MNFTGKFDAKLFADGAGSHSDARVHVDSVFQHNARDAVTIPDAHLLFSGDYTRSGVDLIVSDHLHRVVVPDYFHGVKRPMLVSPEGAPLDPKIIEALTGHVQYAQAAGTAAAPKVVGNVVKITGSASVVRNGVTIVLNTNDVVYQNDVVQTGSGSTLGLVLIDGSTFNLTANARLMLNDLVYDATSTSNSSLITLVQGAASFVAGQVAKSGDMKVATPVATLGIRGTAVILDISAIDGKVSISVVDQQDNAVHAVQVYDRNGTLIGTVTSNGSTLTLTPTATFEVIAQQTNKTLAQVALEFNAFQQILNTYDIGKALVPSTPAPTDGKRGDATPQTTTKFAGTTIAPVDSTAIKLDQQIGGNTGGSNSGVVAGTPVVVAISAGEVPVGAKTTGPAATDPIIVVVNVPATPVPFVVTPSPISQISSGPGDHFGPVMSADGRFVTYDPDGAIFLYDRQSNTTIKITPAGDGFAYTAPTISSDGRYIVYQRSDGFVFIYNNDASDTAHYRQTTQLAPGGSPAISGDGSTILVEHGGTSIGIYDLQGHSIATITPAAAGTSGTVWKPAISADGHVIAFWSSNLSTTGGAGQLFTYNLSTGAVTAIASTATGAGISAASLSADGHFAVYQSAASGGHSEIYLYDLTAGHVVFSTVNAGGGSYNPVISPDGHFIIFASDAKLASDDTNSVADTYVVDVTDPAHPVYKLVSVLADGTVGNQASNLGAAISAGGQFYAFGSSASNFSTGDTNGTGDIFVVDPSSGHTAVIQKSANSPADLTATGVITLTGGSAGVTLSVSDPTGRFTAAFDANGNIRWNFKEPKSDFAALQYGQVADQKFVITLSTNSGATTTPVKVSIVGADHPVVTPVNVAPVATVVALAKGTEDAPYTIKAADLLKGVADIDGPSLSIASVTIKSGGGAIVDNHDGTWTYTPASGFNGAVVFDYTASDGSLTASSTANLNIDSANDAPTDVLLTNASVAENTPAGTIVGTLSAIDPDLGDTATFALIDNPGGTFALDGNKLVVAGALDFESTSSYQIKVRATDSGGLSFDKVITIGVIDVPGVNLTGDAGNNTLIGTVEADTLSGLGGNDVLQGLKGNDFLDGGAGRDFAVYTDAAAGITIDLAAGLVHGTAAGDLALIGTDTLRSIEYVRGSNFNDTFVATGFSTTSINASSITSGSVNNGFEGMGGDDTITGNGGTQIWYRNALGAVTVDLLAGTAQSTAPNDAAGIGHDTFTGVNSIRGSQFNDTLLGSNTFNKTDVFYGGAGNDFIDGRGGYDLVVYSSAIDDTVTGGIQVNLAAGTVVGDASVGTDNLRGVELIRGTNFIDTYTAAGFSGTSTNAASPGTGSFNDFEGMGGNDTITGNNNTRISYTQATAAVRVDLAAGTAQDKADAANGTTFDLAGVGRDTIISGVNQARGSDFDDTLLGSGNTNNFQVENFLGGKGNDFIDGRGGYDRAIYSQTADDPVTGGIIVDLAAGTVAGDASVGTDTLHSVEFIRGSNFNDEYKATGFSGASTNASSFGTTFNEFEGMDGDDKVIGNGNTRVAYYNATAAVAVDLGVGAMDAADFLNATIADLANIGVDEFVSGVNQVAGSQFDDLLRGTSNPSGTTEFFEGRGGNDKIDGGDGFDQALYYIDQSVQSGITIDMAAGSVHLTTPFASDPVGQDTLRSIESVTGTRWNDVYVAVGFGNSDHLDPAANNVGNFGTFNEFQGYGGDDRITGNGNTQIVYYGATAGVTVDLAAGTAQDRADATNGTAFDLAGVGHDTIISGVNQVRGSQFRDIISGDGLANLLDGQGGNDTLDGRGGSDVLFGGTGADTFVYGAGYGAAVIGDFKHGEGDKIDLTGLTSVHSFADLHPVASGPNGQDTFINLGSGNSLTLSNVTASSLGADDFVFAPNHAPTVSAAVTGGGAEGSGIKIVNLLNFASDVDPGAVLHVSNLQWSDVPPPPAGSAPVYPAGFTLSPDGNSLLVDTNALAYDGLAQGSTFASHFSYDVVDEFGALVHQTATVTITGVNDAPVFTGQTAGTAFVANGAAVAIATNVSASDIDSANYNGGSLTATVTAGGQQGDKLSIAGSQYIRLTGAAVEFDSDGDGSFAQFVTIGTLTDNINSLTVALNANAGDAAVAALTQAIRFENIMPTPIDGARTVTFTLNDGGGTANGGHDVSQFDATVAVTTPVNQAPHAIDDTDSITAGQAAIHGNVLTNDTDPENDTLSVSNVVHDAFSEQTFTVDGTYGTLVVGKISGNYTYTLGTDLDQNDPVHAAQAAAVKALGAGVSQTDSFTYTASDGAHGDDAELTITVNGINDAPAVTAKAGNSAGTATPIPETNSALTAQGTLTVVDPDGTDPVSVSVTGVTHTGPTGGLSDITLRSYFSVPGTAVLTPSQTNGQFTWNFNSGSEAFNFLAVGETLSLHYTIRPDDTHPQAFTGDGVVTINIAGTNDAPVVTTETPDNHVLSSSSPNDPTPGRAVDQAVQLSNLGISGDSAVTVDFWFNYTGATYSMPFGFSQYDFVFLDIDAAPGAARGVGFNTGTGDFYGVSRSDLIGTWHHYAMVFDGGDVHQSKLYIDGVEQTLTQLFGSSINDFDRIADDARIGGWTGDRQFALDGKIDNVNIWHGERTAVQIAADMNGTVTGPQPGLVAAYSFENVANGPGGVADASGNGHNGTLSTLTTADVSADPTFPLGRFVNEDHTLLFSSASHNAISVGDADDDHLSVTLSVSHGAVTLASLSGLTINGGANATNTITVYGLVADINAALEGLSYQPALNYNGSDALAVTVSDGALSGTKTVNLAVNPVNDAPVLDLNSVDTPDVSTGYSANLINNGEAFPIAVAPTVTDADSTTLASATVVLTNGEAGDYFTLGSGATSGTLTSGIEWVISGTTGSPSNPLKVTFSGNYSLSDYADAIQQVSFGSTSSEFSQRHIQVTVNDGSVDSNVAVATIEVTAAPSVNHAPTLQSFTLSLAEAPIYQSAAGSYSDADDNTLQGIAISHVDADPATQGHWEYKAFGDWTAIDPSVLSDTNALAINYNASLRFVPVTGYSGTPSLTTYALDDNLGQTSGVDEVYIDVSSHGGSTHISDSVTISAQTVNTFDYEVAPGLVSIGGGLPDTNSGSVIEIGSSTVTGPSGVVFSSVAQSGGSTVVHGQYLDFSVSADGSYSAIVPNAQTLIGEIEANEAAATPIYDTLYYKVLDTSPSGYHLDSVTFTFGDLRFDGPGNTPVAAASGVTTHLTGLSVTDFGAATNGQSELSVTVTIGGGTVGFDPNMLDGIGDPIVSADQHSITFTGDQTAINQNLGAITFTSATAGHHDILMSGVDGPSHSAAYYVGGVVVNDVAPKIGGDLAVIGVRGRGVVVSAEDLSATDPDAYPNELKYTVTAQSHGHLESRASMNPALAVDDTFTQQDVDAGSITWVADPGYVGAGGFSVTLFDGIQTAANATTVGTTAVDAYVQMGLVPYDFVADDPATAMGAGVLQSYSSSGFIIWNLDANRDFYVTGSGLNFADGKPNAGTIDTIVIGNHTTHQVLASLHLNVPAADFYNAVVARAAGDNTEYAALTGNWVTYVEGQELSDTFNSGAANDIFVGKGGGDTFDGGFGYDRAGYGHAPGSINVHLAGDTAHGGGYVTGDGAVGTDVLRSIELVTGSNFADTYDATGFSATSINAGSTVTANTAGLFNEFEGRGGGDTIAGNGTTRISYFHATAGVTVTFVNGDPMLNPTNSWASATSGASGTATGDLSVGTDTFTGVYSVRGSQFSDTWTGSNNPSGTSEDFEGLGGGDIIHGGLGFDRVVYSREEAGRKFQLGDGTVKLLDNTDTHDELRSIEGVWGTAFNDIYDASTFTASNEPAATRSVNSGDTPNSSIISTPSNFNEFEGDAGNDTVTGNTNTRIAYYHATGGVVVALNGTAPGHEGDAFGNASVGHDTIVSGVSRVRGSEFNDIITGSSGNNTLEGRGGNDVLDGGAGNDALTGGIGADIFVYGSSYGKDVIADFNRAEGDRIDLRSSGAIAVTAMVGTYNSSTGVFTVGAGSDTRLTDTHFGSTGSHFIILTGVTSVQASDFIFAGQVAVTVQTPDGYDFGTLYDDLAAANRHQAANDSAHIFAVSGSKTFELTGSFTYAGNDPVNGSVTGGTITGVTILNTIDPAQFVSTTDHPQPTQDQVLVNSDGWNINASTLFTAIGNYANSDPSFHASGLNVLNTIFNAPVYSVVGTSGIVATDDKSHSGADVFFGGSGADVFNGMQGPGPMNPGSDTVDYSHATAGVTVNLSLSGAQNTVNAGSDTLISIENLRGTNANDTLTGDGNNNVLEGGLGNDTLDGGGGNNTVSYEHATPGAGNLGVTVDLTIQGGTTSQNTVQAGSDTLSNFQNVRGSAGNDTLIGNGNNNVLEGGPGADTLNGGGGIDTASYEHAAGVTTGTGQSAIHIGITANLANHSQNTGDAVGDTYTSIENLTGSQFSDRLIGNSGDNILTGLGGNDIFVFASANGHDTITDFLPGHHKIDLDFDAPFSSATFSNWLTSHAEQVNGNSDLLIHLDVTTSQFGAMADHDTILLKNVAIANLHASDFILHPGGFQ